MQIVIRIENDRYIDVNDRFEGRLLLEMEVSLNGKECLDLT
jgi:hypothetical protein